MCSNVSVMSQRRVLRGPRDIAPSQLSHFPSGLASDLINVGTCSTSENPNEVCGDEIEGAIYGNDRPDSAIRVGQTQADINRSSQDSCGCRMKEVAALNLADDPPCPGKAETEAPKSNDRSQYRHVGLGYQKWSEDDNKRQFKSDGSHNDPTPMNPCHSTRLQC